MYMAASTIPVAPATVQPHPELKTPARIRNSPAKGEERSVDEPDDGEREDDVAEVVERARELSEADPDEAEDRGLRDHAREHGRDLGRGLAVGVREPPVQREERSLDRKGDRKAEE